MIPSRLRGAAFASCLSLFAVACVADGGKSDPLTDAGDPQPRMATYSCSDGGMMTLDNLGTSVRILGADGESTEELPASPANQRSRYALASNAIVLDGQEALVMRGSEPTLNCTR